MIPSYDEVMKDDPKKKIPSYQEVMGEPAPSKKKVDSIVSSPTSSVVGKSVPVIQPSEIDENDIIGLSRKAEELSNKKKDVIVTGGVGGGTMQQKDFDAAKEGDKIAKGLKEKGYDSKQITSEFTDFPDEYLSQPGKKEELLQERKDNPIEYGMKLNAIKNRYSILKAVKQNVYDSLPEDDPNREFKASQAGIHAANEYNDLTDHTHLNQLYGNVKGRQQIINDNLTGEDRQKALGRLQQDASQFINGASKELVDEWRASEFAGTLDANQYAGLKTLELFDPEKYKQAVRVLSTNIKPKYHLEIDSDLTSEGMQWGDTKEKEDEETINQRKGKEIIQKNLSDLGRQNAIKFLKRQGFNLDKEYTNAPTDEEKAPLVQKYLQNQDILKTIQEDIKKDDQRYPLLADMKFDEQVKEITQDPGMGAAAYGTYKFGKGFSNSGNTIENILTKTFGSQSDVDKLDTERLGQSRSDQNVGYLPESYKSEGSAFIQKFSKDISDQIKTIYADDNLDWKQKLEQSKEIMSKNQDKVDWVTNPNAGKSNNFFSKATIYSNAGMIGDIASVAAQSWALGAGGVGKVASAAIPMFTTTEADFYKQALAEGRPDPQSYAFTHAGIMALAGMINPDINIVKRSLGLNTAAGRFVAGLDEATWNRVINENKPIIEKFKNSITSAAKEGAKIASVYGAGTSIASDLANKGFGGDNISADEMLTHAVDAIRHTALSSVALLGVNAIKNFRDVSPMQKANVWDLGTNPEINIAKIDEAVKAGQITSEQGNQQKDIIKTVSKLIDVVPTENAKGKPLTDKQRADFLYNLIIKDKANNLKKTVPEQQQEILEGKKAQADEENNHIIEGTKAKPIQIAPDEEKTFTYDSEKDIPKVLLGTKPKRTEQIEGEGGKKIKVTYSGQQLIDAGVAEKPRIRVTAEQVKAGQPGSPEDIIISKAKDNKLGVYSDMVKADPKMAIEVLKDVAQQMYGINDKGEPLEGGSRKGALSLQFDTDTMEAAEKQFPTPESTLKSEENAPKEPIPEAVEGVAESNEPPQASEATGPTLTIDEGSGKPPITEETISQNSGEEKRTGIKNAVSESTRAVLELPKVDVPKLGADHIVLQEGKDLVDNGKIDPQEVVNRINSTNDHNTSRDEAKAMQYYMHQLGNAHELVRKQLSQDLDPIEKATLRGQLEQLSDLEDAATEANIKSGKDWSDVGNIRQILVDQSFSPSREKAVIKEAYGGEIPKDVQLKIDTAVKERDEAINQRNKVEELLREKEAALKIAEMQKESKQNKKSASKEKKDYKGKRDALLDELKQAKEEHEKWLKDNGIQKSGAGFTLTGKMIKIIGKLAANYVEQGVDKVSDIISKVYEDVKGHLEGITKQDIRDAIALHESEKKNKSAEGKEAKIAAGDIENTKSNLKLKFQNHNDWVKANQRISNADYKIKQIKREAFESQKNYYQRGLMWLGRGFRLSVLSGYNVLAKLGAAATIGGALKRIPEQMIGGIYSKIFKGISDKAPIEGYLNAKSEAKFYKEFFDPKKFAKNSWEILKSGSSDLSKRFGGAEYEHVPILYLPTDLHQIIKDPLKRGTFEASFRNGLISAEKNGLDINDVLIVNSIENAAYKRAQYEIFQEQNWLSKKFSKWKSEMEKKGNPGATVKFLADFMIPVSTVPTNIVRRVITTSPVGLIRGSKMVVDAYRKGIENLTNEQADRVMKQLKQGSLGTALWMIGWFGSSYFGGLYSKYNPDKKRQEGDLMHDEMSIDGKMIPKPVQHALPLEIIQFAATARHIYDNYRDNKGSSNLVSIGNAGLGAIGALTEQIPIIETGTHVIGATHDPYEAGKLKEDVGRRFEPQILRETGIIPKSEPSSQAKGKNQKQTKKK